MESRKRNEEDIKMNHCDACGKSQNPFGKQVALYQYSSACKDMLCYECMDEWKAWIEQRKY